MVNKEKESRVQVMVLERKRTSTCFETECRDKTHQGQKLRSLIK